MKFFVRVIILLVCIVTLTSCRERTLVDNQHQEDATKIAALLGDGGIFTSYIESDPNSRGRYRVVVSNDDYIDSLSLISKNGYPRKDTQDFEELTKSSALVPASREVEAIKADRAVAVEIENALMSLDGVSNSSVVVRLNQLKKGDSSSVVVIAEVTPKFAEKGRELLMSVVVKAVPGVVAENVSLVLTSKNESVKEGAVDESKQSAETKNVVQGSRARTSSALMSAFGIVGILGMILGGALVIVLSRSKRFRDSPPVRSSKVERPKTT